MLRPGTTSRGNVTSGHCVTSSAVFLALVVAFLAIASSGRSQVSQFLFDAGGNLKSQKAEISAPPEILSQPQDQVVVPGGVASFSVVGANTRGLTYQWRFNGANIAGATSDALVVTGVSANDAGDYCVVLANSSGSVTSAPAALMLDGDRDGMSDSWELANFGNLNQYPTGDSDGDGVSNLDEFRDGTNPKNSASALFRLTVLSDGASVTMVPAGFTYTNGETVMLTASDPFRAWTGDTNTTNNSITLAMTTNRTVFAHLTSLNLTWMNLGDGDWDLASNWKPNFVPTAADSASISGGTANITGTGTVAVMNLTSGTLGGSGVLTVLNEMNWSGGTMSGSGRTVIAPEATLHLINAGAVSIFNRTLENRGTTISDGEGNLSASSAVITNRAGALFEVRNTTSFIYAGGGASRFDNAGTFRKTTTTGTNTFDFSFNNYGAAEIQTGTLLCDGPFVNLGDLTLSAGATLRLEAGGSASGSFTAPGTALVEWTGGTFTLNPGAQLGGAGLYKISGGTLAFNTDTTVNNLDMNAALSGTGAVTVSNVMNWTRGTMSGAGQTRIAPGATLNINNPLAVVLSARTLENGGAALWTGEGNLSASSAVITNRAGALFEVRNNASFIYQGGGASRFDNAGTFRKTIAAGTNIFVSGFNLNNYGAAEIQGGTLLCDGPFVNLGDLSLSAGATLRLEAGGSASGSFTAPGTALVEWTGGTFILNPGAQLGGAGLYKISGGTLTFNTDATVNNLDMNAGLSGTGAVTVSNVMNWTRGSMSGTGRTRIAPGATLDINNPLAVGLSARTLENGGTVLWTGTNIGLGGAVITNRAGAVFHAQNAASLAFSSGANRFDNAGTFRKSGNTGTTTLAGGVTFNNYGTAEIRSGILAANAGYTSSSGAMLQCALGGTNLGTGYGRLQVSGAVTLNGALRVDLIDGFIPAVSDSFTVLTAGTRNGTFASFFYPSNAVTMQLSNTANSVLVRVTDVVIAIPQPLLLTPELVGSDIKLSWTSVSNINYRLEFNPDLATLTNWNPIPGDVTAVTNTASKLDPLTPSNRLYRVRVLP